MSFASGDLVIVGGGPAGLTTALALARRSPQLRERIVVLEAGKYPREKPCAGALGARGDKILAELGAAPKVPSVIVDGMSVRTTYGEVSATVGGIGRVVRRIEFDAALAELVKKRGIRVEDGTRVTSIEVGKIRARVVTSRGDLDAKVVVGADGVGSIVRKALGLGRGLLRAQVLELDTEPVKGDRDRGLLHFDAADRRFPGYTWDFPTLVDGQELYCRGIYHLKLDDAEVDIAKLFDERLAEMGLDSSKYKNKRYAERGFEPSELVARGPLLLTGEAAGIDPVTGEGIAQAIEYGALAGDFVARAVERSEPLEGFARELGTSRLARDLTVRTRAVQAFYGRARPRMEGFLTNNPDTLHIGCQHFAAQRIDRTKLAQVALKGGLALLADGAERVLAAIAP